MEALFIIMNEVERLNDVLAALRDAGAKGATILDSVGFGRTSIRDLVGLPLIAGLMPDLETTRPHNRTIVTVLDDPEVAEAAIAAVQAVLGDLCCCGKGIMFTVPVTRAIGLNRSELRQHEKNRDKNRPR
jgi:nitrogen regulatory protein PII